MSIFEDLINANDDLILPNVVVKALSDCYWPGRCQTLIYKNLTLYIDGAHTKDSVQLCIDWFKETTSTK